MTRRTSLLVYVAALSAMFACAIGAAEEKPAPKMEEGKYTFHVVAAEGAEPEDHPVTLKYAGADLVITPAEEGETQPPFTMHVDKDGNLKAEVKSDEAEINIAVKLTGKILTASSAKGTFEAFIDDQKAIAGTWELAKTK